MKKILTIVCCLIATLAVGAQDFESAADAVKNMGVGWNLGNTLDANNQSAGQTDPAKDSFWGQAGLDSENCWGQPTTKPGLLKMMKEAGFGAVRVPITWYNHMDASGKVDAAWMARVRQVVDYVLDQGMYCLINVHHDTGADDSGKSYHWIKADGAVYAATKARFEYLWRQIATEFRDYGQQLLFEGYNEMVDGKSTWNEPANKTDGYKAVNDYARSFVSAVRSTGGNNTQRNLVVNTYAASNSPAAMAALELPEQAGHMAFQIHSYPDWQSESHARQLVDNLVSNISSGLMSKGAPVIVGEYSTYSVWPERDWYDVNRQVALYAMDYFVRQTKAAGIATFYWMGLSDGANRSLPVFSQADLAETITKAYHGAEFEGKYPSVGDLQLEYHVEYTGPWQELNLYSGAPVKLTDYKGLRLELKERPAAGALQIKVYGEGSRETGYPLSANASTTVYFESAKTGGSVARVTLQTMAGTAEATVVKAALIKADGSETPTDVSVFWGCTLTQNAVTPTGISDARKSLPVAAVYNLRGLPAPKPSKGIYIQNGRKIAVR